MTAHQAVSSFPISPSGTSSDKTQIRHMLVKRTAYCIDTASEAQNLVAVDPDTADIPICLILLGRVYLFDAADVTSIHDGTTVLVTSDGKRYKLASGSEMVAYSVINVTTTAPPGSPTIGDQYLVATGGTGAWAGHDGEIATFTSRGWEFSILQIGRFIYAESTDSYYHKLANGTLTLGFGAQTLQSNTHPASALIGRPVRWFVINQTTNTPPGSPSIGDAYIIGSSPTGVWSGKAGQIAIREITDWAYYVPRDGELAYDDTNNIDYRFNSAASAWQSAAGAVISAPTVQFTISGSITTGGSGNYSYSDTVAPTSSQAYAEDSVTITYTARKTNARLRLHYSYVPNSGARVALSLFRDSVADALDWYSVDTINNEDIQQLWFDITAPDTSSHIYKIRTVNMGAGVHSAATRRRFYIEEFA